MSDSAFSQVRQIDNTRRSAPFATVIGIGILIFLAIWFLRGESFRLYASLFFGLYYLTHSSWLSIILVSVVQNIFFLPIRIISSFYQDNLKDFEHALEKTKADDQYFVLKKQVTEGNVAVIFYIIHFVLFFIAFISAGRVFFLEFYHTPIDRSWLYDWIPYPDYPLQGVLFYFPWFRVTSTFALSWQTIFYIWAIPVAILALIRLLWLIVKPLVSGNQPLLHTRIRINRLKFFIGGFIGTVFLVSLYLFRHLPSSVEFNWLVADLSQQNTAFNIITALATAFATIYGGFRHNLEAGHEARKRGIPEHVISLVGRRHLRTSVQNAVMLSLFAVWVTRLMPCSHDLSVLAFEALYLLSPVTFDLLIPKKRMETAPVSTSSTT